MKARVTVTLKSGILDPQGKAIEGALRSLGLAGVSSVRQGKVFDIEIDGGDRAKAEALLKQAAGIAKGSGVPNKEKVGKVTNADVEKVVKMKMADLNARDVDHAVPMIEGTVKSMGLVVEG